MAEGTPIGALAVRIGADASDLISELGKADQAVAGTKAHFVFAAKEAAKFAGAIAAAGAALFAFAKANADVADQLGKMSQKVGLSVEALSELKYSAGLADVSLESLGTGLKQLSKHMLEAQTGSAEMREAFRALGVSATDGVGGPLRKTDQVLFDIAEKFSKFPDGPEKSALAMRLFGKSGADLIPLLNQGRDGLIANAEEARKLGVVLSTEAAKNAEEFNDNLRRLKASSEGLAQALAGPLIKALGDAAGEMVKAKVEGEGFFATWERGLAMLLTGGDLHKWEKDFVEATEKLDIAQRQLIAAKAAAMSDNAKLWPDKAAASVAKYTDAVVKAQGEVTRLQAIKPMLLPEDPAKPNKQTGDVPQVRDLDKERKDGELITRQLQEDEEERLRITSGAIAATVALRDKEIVEEKRLLEDRLKAIYDAYDAEQEAAIRQGEALVNAEGMTHNNRLLLLGQSHKNAIQLENEAFTKRLEELEKYGDAELEAIGGRQKITEDLERQHWDNIRNIRKANLDQLAEFSRASWDQQTAYMVGSLESMTASAAQHSQRMFKIHKVASLANAIIKGWESIQASYAFGAEWGGPIGGAAMAAIAAAAVATNIKAIKDTTFHGGGAVPTFNASPATGLPVQSQQAGPRGPDTIIHLQGDGMFSEKTIRELLQRISENNRNGGRVVVV